MKYMKKKKLIAVMALLIVAVSFGGCNSSNTAAAINSEVTSSEIVSSAPVSSEVVSSKETSSEAVSSAPVSSEAEKPESEAVSSEAAASSVAEAPATSSEPAISSAPTAVSQSTVSSAPAAVSKPVAASQPVSSTASSAPVESVPQTSSALPAQAVSAPAQQQSGSTKSIEDMTEDELEQWALDRLNEQLSNINVREVDVRELRSSQLAEGVGDVYEAIRLINEERVKAGLNELEIDDTMMEMAAVRAKEQAVTFGHTRPDGSSCWTIFDDFGQSQPAGVENAGAGVSGAGGQVDAWMNSTGHKENILQDWLTRIGVGFYYQADSQYGYYWIMLAAS